jgi:hypothetical protein
MRYEQMETMVRAGVDNPGFRRTGKRGQPFALTSTVDAPSLASAADLYGLTYRNIPAQVVNLTKDGLNWGKHVVMLCQPAPLQAVGTMAGGFSPDDVSKQGWPSGYGISTGPSLALLVVQWTLIGLE